MASNQYWPDDLFGFYLNRAYSINMNHLWRSRPPVVGVRARGVVVAGDTGPNLVAAPAGGTATTRILKFGEDPDELPENVLTPDELMTSDVAPTWVEGLTREQVEVVMTVDSDRRQDFATGFRMLNEQDREAEKQRRIHPSGRYREPRHVSRTAAANPNAIGEVFDMDDPEAPPKDPNVPLKFTVVDDLSRTRPLDVVKRHKDHSRGYGLFKGRPLDR